MGIQRNAVSFSHRLREQVRSTLTSQTGGETAQGDDGGDGGASDSFGNLFHCSGCRDVYIATEKRVCPKCDEEVEQVRSTLACKGQ